MKRIMTLTACLAAGLLAASLAAAKEHPGREYIEKEGYRGPATCETCHPGTAGKFLESVHWKHASKVTNVDNLDPQKEYGMKNRIYTFCNGNEVVNDLKETPKNAAGKSKFTGCNSCHPGDHLNKADSTGPGAEKAIDCLVCHSAAYDFRMRKAGRNAEGDVVMGQDRSTKAALAISKPNVKNCMVCHETAGGGSLLKRGFSFTKETDVHAAKGMVCVDCHKSKDHKVPTGFDPNNWANDGVRLSCAGCHGEKPHNDPDYDRHTAVVACQTCHITSTGGAVAKDFTHWTKLETGFYEPSTIKRAAAEGKPAYAWFNGEVLNTPHLIGPKGRRGDGKSRIFPFKIYEGHAYYDRTTGKLLLMDFAEPTATGDTLAGVASAAKTLGLTKVDPVPGWQTIYFANSHLVTRQKALTCDRCHSATGVLDFQALGYSKAEVEKRGLRSAALWFDKLLKKEQGKDE
jgi:hypothetical protein